MTEFITCLIRYTVMFVCCFYTFTKAARNRLKALDLLFVPVFSGISAGMYYVAEYIVVLIPLCFLIFSTAVFLIRFRHTFADTVSLCTISLGINIFLMVVSVAVSIPPLALVYLIKNEAVKTICTQAVLSLVQCVLVILLFKIRRFKSGILSFKSGGAFERLILASVICIFGMTVFSVIEKTSAKRDLILIFLIFCGLSLIVWWRRLITGSYKEQVLKRNTELLEQTTDSLEKEKAQLVAQNEKFAKIIHRDNKMIPAIKLAAENLAKKYPNDGQAAELSAAVAELYSERLQAIEDYRAEEDKLARTGISTLDAVLQFMGKTAKKQGTEFSFDFSEEALALIAQTFKEQTTVNTLVADLTENALIAVRGLSGGKVKTVFDVYCGAARICVFDNGAPFDEKVIANMGRSKITTHATEGGSGIGLMSTFEISGKIKASFRIDELTADGFTKCVSVIADGKNRCVIYTDRESVRRICKDRSDFFCNIN